MGDTATILMTRYELGPWISEPSMPVIALSVGRTTATDEDPVTPNTTKAIAASLGLSRQLGRG
jgi:hypothetical protein